MRKPIKETMPPLHLQRPEFADRGTVRLGSSAIAASELPPLTLPTRNIADRGTVRLGSSAIAFER
jgi:hypothetical protein